MTEPLPPPVRGHAAPEPALRWLAVATCPPEWPSYLRRLGGGFFHSPAGLGVAAPPGEPTFLTLHAGNQLLGVAAGVWRRCRLTRSARHFHAPTLPALAEGASADLALRSMRAHLQQWGAADAVLDSYGAQFDVDFLEPAATGAPRYEYVVALEPGREGLMERCASNHRRSVRRGEGAGWTLRMLEGSEAQVVMEAVRGAAALRAGERATAAMRAPLAGLEGLSAPRPDGWGLAAFSAWAGSALLAAALVGWATDRACFVAGGSTGEGYRVGAAVWLHWRIMTELAEAGFRTYNLGGTPAVAADLADPEHGLFRFKQGFGSAIVSRRGVRWRIDPRHLAVHRIARWLAAPLGGAAAPRS